MDFQGFIQNFVIKIHNIKGRCSFMPPGPGTNQSPLLHTRASCFTSELVTLYRNRTVLPVTYTEGQWHIQELFSEGVQQIQLRTERTGIWGRSPLVRGSGGSCNLVQEISFHIVKFS